MSVSETQPTTPGNPSIPKAHEAEEEALLSKDQIFHILQVQRRRDVLRYLKGTEGPVRMRDVAEQVAAWEHDTTVAALTSEERQRVYIALYQAHLPKLDTEGIIDYQQSRGIVERTPVADQFDPYLETPEPDDDIGDVDAEPTEGTNQWPIYYFGASGVSALLIGGVALQAPVLSAFSGFAAGALVLLLFSALTVGQLISESSPGVE